MANGMPKDYKYVECRLLKHAWSIYDDPSSDASLHLECSRCYTLRIDWISRLGELERRKYVYPENYRLKQTDRPNAEKLRVALMLRLRKRK